MLQISLFPVATIIDSGLIHTMIIILSVSSRWISSSALSYILSRVKLVLLNIHAVGCVYILLVTIIGVVDVWSLNFVQSILKIALLFVYIRKSTLCLLVLINNLIWFYICANRNVSSFVHCSFSDWTIINIAIWIKCCIDFSWSRLMRISMSKFIILIIFYFLWSYFYIFNNILFLILLLFKIPIFQ